MLARKLRELIEHVKPGTEVVFKARGDKFSIEDAVLDNTGDLILLEEVPSESDPLFHKGVYKPLRGVLVKNPEHDLVVNPPTFAVKDKQSLLGLVKSKFSKPKDLPNYKHIGGNMFVCRTQAGFKQALKIWANGSMGTKDTQGYPKAYPSIVGFSNEYFGYHYIHAHCIPLNTFNEALADQ